MALLVSGSRYRLLTSLSCFLLCGGLRETEGSSPSPIQDSSMCDDSKEWERWFYVMSSVAGAGWISFTVILCTFCFHIRMDKPWRGRTGSQPNNTSMTPKVTSNRYEPQPVAKKVATIHEEEALRVMLTDNEDADFGKTFQNPLFASAPEDSPDKSKRLSDYSPGMSERLVSELPARPSPLIDSRSPMPPPVPNTRRPSISHIPSRGIEESTSFHFSPVGNSIPDARPYHERQLSSTSNPVLDNNLFRSSSSSFLFQDRPSPPVPPRPAFTHIPLPQASHEDFVRADRSTNGHPRRPHSANAAPVDDGLMRAHSAIEVSNFISDSHFDREKTQTTPRKGLHDVVRHADTLQRTDSDTRFQPLSSPTEVSVPWPGMAPKPSPTKEYVQPRHTANSPRGKIPSAPQFIRRTSFD